MPRPPRSHKAPARSPKTHPEIPQGTRPGEAAHEVPAAGPGLIPPAGPGLNPAQAEAARTLHGPLLVIAGAGTGKTRTLIHRLVSLLRAGVPADAILLLTFTRRAAQEMLDRASALLGEDCQRVSGGTFHAFANATLRRLVPALRNATILDQADCFDIIGELRAARGVGRSFPRRETLGGIISKAQNYETPLAKVVAREYAHLLPDLPAIEAIALGYAAYKRERGLLDYDDLLIELATRLHDDPAFRARVTERYEYVMVDEYQDTNIPQARITRLLCGPGRNVMVVGDDAQSIYAFRGARADNLFDFHGEFPDAVRVTLEENYRSTQPILDVANALLGQMSRSFHKTLFTGRRGGELPVLVWVRDEEAQATYVADQIDALIQAGLARTDIAVLFRASSHAYALEVELSRRKIPFVKYGGFRFMEAAHIKDALSHLRIVQNPNDDLAMTRVLRLCPGVGMLGARKIRESIQGRSLSEALSAYRAKGPLREALDALSKLLGEIAVMSAAGAAPASLLQRVCVYYAPLLKQNFEDAERRARDLVQLCDLCKGYRSLEAMLTDLSLQPPTTGRGEALVAEDPGSVVLSTMHSAKGLEWRAVFILQAIDGAMPMYAPYGEGPDRDQLDEELRLLYVAVTRARDHLHLVWPGATRRGFDFCEVSRFLQAVPPKLLSRTRGGGTRRR